MQSSGILHQLGAFIWVCVFLVQSPLAHSSRVFCFHFRTERFILVRLLMHSRNLNQLTRTTTMSTPTSPPPRINREHFEEELANKWLEKGFRNTLFGLFTAPGKRIYDYIHNDREVLLKPVAYLLMTTAFMLVINSNFPRQNNDMSDEINALFDNMAYLQLLHAAILSWLMTRVFYRAQGYNFYENAVVATYVLAQVLLIDGVFILLQHFLSFTWLSNLDTVISLLYCSLAIAQFYQARVWSDYLKAALVVGLGFAIFLFVALFFVILLILAK